MASGTALLGLTEQHDLRTGNVPWHESAWAYRPSDPFPAGDVDIAILGCGIMGAILAERLSGASHRLALFDRRPPGCGSTTASTAEIMWAMDVPMTHLARALGETEAARRWTSVYRAVRDLAGRIDALGIDGARIERPTIYLAGNVLDEAELAEEAAMHKRHWLPSDLLGADEVAERFGIAPRAAIVSSGGYEVDPVRLCHAMLDRAADRGARLIYPLDIVALHPVEDGIVLEAADGRTCQAREVILATGYERASLFLPAAFSLHSTFAIATAPGVAPLWRENAMIWEASDPYLYVRTDREGRIIAGGEDVEASQSAVRDALIGTKAGIIAAKLEAMIGSGRIEPDRRWAATFGFSPDGLPAIGRSSLMPHVWISAGFGGNGIAFAGLAAEILESEIAGRPHPDSGCFDPYRFAGS